MGWTNGRVVLARQPLGDVVRQLQRWYGLQVGLADSGLASRPVSLDAPLDGPREAIAAIESQAGVKYSYAGRDLVFRDTAAGKAK
jgi:ferric-dicitrate binding protein FerR (iron transport regulator)